MNQVPIVSSNVRQRLAPADPALLPNIRPSRDPRLLRQTQNTPQLSHGNAVAHSAQPQTALPPAQRMAGIFPNNHRNRIPRYSQNESVMTASGPIDLQSKDVSKETKNRSSSASSYKKSSSKSSSSVSSKSKSSSKGSSSKSSRGSSRSGSGRARSSSSSKDRKDDSKSPRKFNLR